MDKVPHVCNVYQYGCTCKEILRSTGQWSLIGNIVGSMCIQGTILCFEGSKLSYALTAPSTSRATQSVTYIASWKLFMRTMVSLQRLLALSLQDTLFRSLCTRVAQLCLDNYMDSSLWHIQMATVEWTSIPQLIKEVSLLQRYQYGKNAALCSSSILSFAETHDKGIYDSYTQVKSYSTLFISWLNVQKSILHKWSLLLS